MKIIRGREGDGEVHEFNRPSGLSCDDNGRIVIADSKNQRVLVYNTNLDFQWVVSIKNAPTWLGIHFHNINNHFVFI